MSAYMVDRDHIQFLIEAAKSRRINRCGGQFSWWHDDRRSFLDKGPGTMTLTEAGQMLWDENRKSINARYPDCVGDDENLPGPIGESFVYVHRHNPCWSIDPVQVIKSCHCLRYQSCEHDAWEDSAACAFLDSLIDTATHALVGYDDAAWGAPHNPAKAKRCG
jgi:hypothetical protein